MPPKTRRRTHSSSHGVELPSLRDADRFDAWLRRLVVNACYDEARRVRRRAEVSLVSITERSIADSASATAETDRVERAFRRLPLDQRTVIALQHYLGLTQVEIAETLGIPLGTVKSRLRYGVTAMRAELDADDRSPGLAEEIGMSDPIVRDVDQMLDRWIDAVAPERAPTSLLEGTFARTMTTSQARPVPWRQIRIGPRPKAAFAPLAWVAVIVILAVAIAAVALFGGGGPPLLPVVTPSPTGTAGATTSPSPPASPSGPPPISVTPEATIAVENPLFMATDGTVPWLINQAGEVVRIDPAANKIGASKRIGPSGDPYQGIAADANAVWVTDWTAGHRFRVDPGTLEATTTTTASALRASSWRNPASGWRTRAVARSCKSIR